MALLQEVSTKAQEERSLALEARCQEALALEEKVSGALVQEAPGLEVQL